jgi:hypothetical protein
MLLFVINMRVITIWIKSMVMVFFVGKVETFTVEITKMTREMDMER